MVDHHHTTPNMMKAKIILVMRSEEQKHEAFGLEPQSIEVGSDVHGDFVVVEGGLVRALFGFLL